MLGYDDVLLPIIEACFGKHYIAFTSIAVSTWDKLILKQFQTTDVSTYICSGTLFLASGVLKVSMDR
jgi:hypothetical protein